MVLRLNGLVALVTVLLPAVGCGIDGSLASGGPGGADAAITVDGSADAASVVLEAGAESGNISADGSGPDGGTASDDGGPVSTEAGSKESGVPDAAPPVCDGGSSLNGACAGASGCCAPLFCTTAMTCQWTCSQNGPCTSDSNCCSGSYCGTGNVCTCIQTGSPCTRDTQCCSIITGGGCESHGDAGRVCGGG